MKKLIFLFLFVMISIVSFTQSPQSFKYQSVIRDGSGLVIPNQLVSMRIGILEGSISGPVVYQEEHSVTTNDFGLVNLEIGNGNVVSGDFSLITWGSNSYFIKIELDENGGTTYQPMGVSQLLSVPYAMFADKAGNVNNNDTSATNELQIISISNDTIYLTNGGYAIIPAGFSGDYNDLANAPLNLTDFTNDAGFIIDPTDADADPTNELQIISISNDTMYLTNGGYAILPAGFSGDYNDLTNAPLNLTDFTNDAGFIIDPTDADADPTNELQILSISNDTLYLSGGNSLYLENLSDTSYWERIGDNLYYDLGNVSVGSNIVNPSGRLQVTSDPTAGVNDVIFSVLNADGDTVFAVYQEGVRIWVNDDGSKATGNRGGFAVGGFSPSKNTTNEYLRVTPDSVRVYIEEGSGTKATGNRGGFAVGGFSPSKSFTDYYFNVEYSDDAEIIDPSTPRLLWYPQREALLSGKVLILHPDSVGTNSFTSGYESRAKGNWSHALGYKAIARGNYSTSIGKYSKAYGENSFAFGDSAKTLNRDSYAFGAGAVTEGKGCYAFGAVMRNSDGTPTSLFTKAVGDYSLALGFGAESNGFMSIAFGSRAISTGDYSMVFGYEAEASGIWAMALGDNTHATGYFSLAMGTFTTASGNASTAFGRGCEASGSTSVAGGVDCIATGQGSVALGDRARAQGFYYSTAFGGRTTASGKGAFAAGDTTIASGDYSVAIGASNISSAMSSTSFGSSNIASGFAAMALNSHTDASGMMATAMGLETDAQSYASLVIGRYNTIAGSANSWVATDPIFVIGTGSTPGARKNAMTVLKNGEVYMPDVYTDAVGVTNLPLYIDNTGKLGYLSSSRRYKKNIIDMENVDWLYNLRPVNFYYKNDNENILQYGLIAEEVELVNPKFVIYSSDGKIETVQYNNLISPMLKALQNQNAKISKQECEIIDLKKRISDMENLLKINSKK